ncbi:enoyl-CoA hydratase-related protein [Oceanobacillus sp. CAU 1775]
MFETILYEVKNNTAYITLNRPEKLNAFTEQMNKEITKAIKDVKRDDAVRCLVITGSGRAFSAGEDLGGLEEDINYANILRDRYHPMLKELINLEKPVVAAVNGTAAGAGMSLALACDFRLMSEKASFIEAFIHIGLIPDCGNLYFLPRLVGHAKALELAVLGEKVSAHEAKELGLATKVFAEDEFLDGVNEFTNKLAVMPTKAIGLIKRYMQESWELNLDELLEKEAYAQQAAGNTEDHKEGINAFLNKRKAVYNGR